MKIDKNFLDKVIHGQVKVLDESLMIIDHCISDNLADRVGDDIDTEGWETENFMLNPVVLEIHDYSKPPVGKSLGVYKQGNQLRAKTQFAPTDEGKKYFQLYKDGYMNAFSVGFIPKEYTPNQTGGYHMIKQELLEYSVVPVPCNPRALKSFIGEEKEIETVDLKELIQKGEFDYEGKKYFIVDKVGAKINRKNKDKLNQALNLIDEVLNDAEALEDDEEGKSFVNDLVKILKNESEGK